jgi:hypothetical protein
MAAHLGAAPDFRARAIRPHFRVVISRPPGAARTEPGLSLFAHGPPVAAGAADAYAGLFADVVAGLPTAASLGARSFPEFVERLSLAAPVFVDERSAIQAEAVLWYAREIIKSESPLVPRFCAVVSARDRFTLTATDRTCSLRSQHQRLASALELIVATRANLQSHLNLELAEALMRGALAPAMKASLFRGHEFVTNVDALQSLLRTLAATTNTVASDLGVTENMQQICRVLFFKLTAHVTFWRFLKTDELVWKHSIIIGMIVEKNRARILAGLASAQTEAFAARRPYFERAADMLGHIKNNSGLSVVVYYVVEVVHMVHTLCTECRELSFDDCLVWILVSADMKHVFPISHYLQHFILNRGKLLEMMFEKNEIGFLSLFPPAVMCLLEVCKTFDKRVADSWAASSVTSTATSSAASIAISMRPEGSSKLQWKRHSMK